MVGGELISRMQPSTHSALSHMSYPCSCKAGWRIGLVGASGDALLPRTSITLTQLLGKARGGGGSGVELGAGPKAAQKAADVPEEPLPLAHVLTSQCSFTRRLWIV